MKLVLDLMRVREKFDQIVDDCLQLPSVPTGTMATKRPPLEEISRNGNSIEIRSYDNHGKVQYQFQVGRGKDRQTLTRRSLEEIRRLAIDYLEGRWAPPPTRAASALDSLTQATEAPIVFTKSPLLSISDAKCNCRKTSESDGRAATWANQGGDDSVDV
jgi:hypothetical protein